MGVICVVARSSIIYAFDSVTLISHGAFDSCYKVQTAHHAITDVRAVISMADLLNTEARI